MVTRHRWTLSVKCPRCEKLGDVKVAEEAGPPFTDDPPRRRYLDGEGFHARGSKFGCLTCGAAFLPPA
jgi:hypothetical protein